MMMIGLGVVVRWDFEECDAVGVGVVAEGEGQLAVELGLFL